MCPRRQGQRNHRREKVSAASKCLKDTQATSHLTVGDHYDLLELEYEYKDDGAREFEAECADEDREEAKVKRLFS